MYDIPQITTQHILDLLNHDNPDAVLYLNSDDGGQPTLDVWVSAHVPHQQQALTRDNAVDVLCPFGETDLGPDDVEHMLPTYQDDVDRAFAEVYGEDR